MLADRNINRPSYVVALLLGLVAIADAVHALIGMETGDPCAGISKTTGIVCGANAGWFVDLLTAGICAVLVTLLLLRPHLWVFAIAVLWSFIAFLANFVMKGKGGDNLATFRMASYFLVFMIAGVLTIIDGQEWLAAKWARRPAGQPWYGGPAQPQIAPPPAPPAAPPKK